MAKYKSYNYSQTMMKPISLEDQLTDGAREGAINMLVGERMKMTRFDTKLKNDETGCKAYHPRILLKIILLPYEWGVVHSRKVKRVCKKNVTL